MNKTGLDSYVNEQKKAWRGWQANQIVMRLPEFYGNLCVSNGRWELRQAIPKKGTAALKAVTCHKTVLYLCGPEDLDRPVLLSRGFDARNLIAVDINQAAIANARQQGAIGISESLSRVLNGWNDDAVDVVIADLCCGFTSTLKEIWSALHNSRAIKPGTVLSFNLQRGRDMSAGAVLGTQECQPLYDLCLHRGQRLWWLAYWEFGGAVGDEMKQGGWSKEEAEAWLTNNRALSVAAAFSNNTRPAYNSYRSKSVTMDSIVFRWPWGQTDDNCLASVPVKTRRKLAALKAVRTMKLRSIGA